MGRQWVSCEGYIPRCPGDPGRGTSPGQSRRLTVLVSSSQYLDSMRELHTLVEVVLVLLASSTAASSLVHLVADAAEEATALLLLPGRSASRLLLVLLLAAGELIDEVHGDDVLVDWWRGGW